ncbi:MAG TPA: TIGR03013 family XrtA/PEP-CTERM system glycosyltransferase [Nitrospira sp.]|nr:TIGR03013 family XrtA/PEP-CTERM system glycosyltransferase [Nitrospira sp.]
MPFRTVEVMRDEAAVEQRLQLCRFTEDVYPTWDILNALTFRRRMLILGAGKLAGELSRAVLSQRFGLVEIIGALVGENERLEWSPSIPGVIGTHGQLAQMVEELRVDTIVVCLEDRRSVLPVERLLDMKAMGIDVLDGHQLFEEVSGRLSVESLRPSAVIFSTGFKQRMVSRVVKRFVDLLVSISGLVILSPLFLLVALLIKFDSAGPVIYRQTRVGLRGRSFLIWKFRSMRQDAEMAGPQWAQADDPRISRVGRWLRKTRMDEFPQLINVLKGEMSLVGPRPERPVFVQDLRKIIPYYDLRHTVRPGITGWAQVKFRYGASAEDAHMKLQYDLYYVKRLSFALDMRVLVQTMQVMLVGEGAR